jgi:hypothetical protein
MSYTNDHAAEYGDPFIVVIGLLKQSAVMQPIHTEQELYMSAVHTYRREHKVDITLSDQDKDRIFREFYDVPEEIQTHVEHGTLTDDLLQPMFEAWAATGLQFDNRRDDYVVMGSSINAFLERCLVTRFDAPVPWLLGLRRVWERAVLAVQLRNQPMANIQRRPYELRNRQSRSGIPMPHGRDLPAPFITFRSSAVRNRSFYVNMLCKLNDMNKAFPNRSNVSRGNENNKKYSPTSVHVAWFYKTASLIAYHIARKLEDENTTANLSAAMEGERRCDYKYSVTDPRLRRAMTELFRNHIVYDVDILRKYGVKKLGISGPVQHFEKTCAIGVFVTDQMNKLDRGMCTVDAESCSGLPGQLIIYKHDLFFRACGLY